MRKRERLRAGGQEMTTRRVSGMVKEVRRKRDSRFGGVGFRT
jgi:hypothetical protein